MKLVPGARVEMQGPADGAGDIMVRDPRSIERRFVPHGLQCLVIGVECFNLNNPVHSSFVILFHIDHGFFRTEATRIRVLWSPDDEPNPPAPQG
jgi:hypothetical protein